MYEPGVSVVTIFHNAAEFIGEAIESVLAQDMDSWELLLVDDGSTDASSSIARNFAARHADRIRYLEHDGHSNRGMSASRNLGISQARGRFIAFIDADDIWRPCKLREQLAIFDAFPELGAVFGAVNYWRSWAGLKDEVIATGHVQDAIVHPPEASLALYPLGRAAAPCPSDVIVRREVVDRLGGFEAHFTGPRQLYEDQGFFAKLYLNAPVYFSSSVWLDYRQHANSCVATVHQDGRYWEVRGYFLNWFDGYLAANVPEAVKVQRAVKAALTECRRNQARAGPQPSSLWGKLFRRVQRLSSRL